MTDRALDLLLAAFSERFLRTGATKTELLDAVIGSAVYYMPRGHFNHALADALKSGVIVDVGTKRRPVYRADPERYRYPFAELKLEGAEKMTDPIDDRADLGRFDHQ
jgi:hypothetical protein